jgi:hypothetical protein
LRGLDVVMPTSPLLPAPTNLAEGLPVMATMLSGDTLTQVLPQCTVLFATKCA